MQAFQFWDNIWISIHVSFTFLLLASLVQQYSSHMTSHSNLRLCNNISCLTLITFAGHMNPITSWTSLLERFEPSYQPWIPCSQFSFYNFACHFWVPHELTSFITLELSYQIWIPCSSIFHSHVVLGLL